MLSFMRVCLKSAQELFGHELSQDSLIRDASHGLRPNPGRNLGSQTTGIEAYMPQTIVAIRNGETIS